MNTGCGFENEGMTIFISDVYGKKKSPILGRCWYLRPQRFLRFQGKHYLLITAESESPEKDFWLYDVSGGNFVLHADGEIRDTGKGRFSYGRYEEDGDFKKIGKVTIDTLISHAAPLKLLPRYPIHGRTRARGVRVYEADSCYTVNDAPYKTIKIPGTKVLILDRCEDGSYHIYHDGFTGRVRQSALKAIEFTSEK